MPPVNGRQFIANIRQIGRITGTPVTWLPWRGKGSHGTLYFGDSGTLVQDLKKDLRTGIFHKMCRDLDLDPKTVQNPKRARR